MNIYYAYFEVAYIGAAGTETTTLLERVIAARDKLHAETLLGRWYTFANDYDDDVPNIDTLHVLASDIPRRRGGALATHEESWWLWFMQQKTPATSAPNREGG